MRNVQIFKQFSYLQERGFVYGYLPNIMNRNFILNARTFIRINTDESKVSEVLITL